MDNRVVKISKFLSLVLRHQPEKIGLRLSESGWASVEQLIETSRSFGVEFTLEELHNVVANNDKKRFSLSEDGLWIRANQGHSVKVELGYSPTAPPEILYHGTAERFLTSIEQQGLIKGKRHHVHLSADADVAAKVGRRHGRPVVLRIEAGRMRQDGFVFYLSTNGVWLTEHVPVQYLVF
ncbi:MAG TPA: RNA 2'-phosphotransferase [Blastocatellia bacterium]|jgi:putative RNA 2'-phosphotransferase|nr:RNA 2'-phosphotransferase [Blastocatellia bacterium]